MTRFLDYILTLIDTYIGVFILTGQVVLGVSTYTVTYSISSSGIAIAQVFGVTCSQLHLGLDWYE
ncbi:hypothetical protein K504DRAFT_532492 [Pleomassaria siparia CBS 279.74]|uniref:Uncharacterized protein n=1 Tax=Pleomassaria siparia CBS 279.74 TaxID=1314801 RepID=A0A6G1KDU5_9PLEO|nr:hypothetical protein K504DRAFT_532492 [Pleomassaria siparia CBS 279.74]